MLDQQVTQLLDDIVELTAPDGVSVRLVPTFLVAKASLNCGVSAAPMLPAVMVGVAAAAVLAS